MWMYSSMLNTPMSQAFHVKPFNGWVKYRELNPTSLPIKTYTTLVPSFAKKGIIFQRYFVFFKTRGHLSRLAWPTQRDGLSCLASPRLALRCAAWPSETNPDPCCRPVATSGCSHRYYNGIVHNAKCINIAFFSVRQAMFRYQNDCLKW